MEGSIEARWVSVVDYGGEELGGRSVSSLDDRRAGTKEGGGSCGSVERRCHRSRTCSAEREA